MCSKIRYIIFINIIIRRLHNYQCIQNSYAFRSNREYLAPQICSMNNWFHSEAKLQWSHDYPLANHIATNKSSANREMPLFLRLYPSFGYLRKIFLLRCLKYSLLCTKPPWEDLDIDYEENGRNESLAVEITLGCGKCIVKLYKQLIVSTDFLLHRLERLFASICLQEYRNRGVMGDSNIYIC